VPEDDWICAYCTGDLSSSEDDDFSEDGSSESDSPLMPTWRLGGGMSM